MPATSEPTLSVTEQLEQLAQQSADDVRNRDEELQKEKEAAQAAAMQTEGNLRIAARQIMHQHEVKLAEIDEKQSVVRGYLTAPATSEVPAVPSASAPASAAPTQKVPAQAEDHVVPGMKEAPAPEPGKFRRGVKKFLQSAEARQKS